MVSHRHCIISFAIAVLMASCAQKPALSGTVELVDWPHHLRLSDAEILVIIADEFPMGDAPRDFRVPPENFGKSEKT